MIHFTFEGSFLYLSTFGRQVITSSGPFAELCQLEKRPTYLWCHVLIYLKGRNMLARTLAGVSRTRPYAHSARFVLSLT